MRAVFRVNLQFDAPEIHPVIVLGLSRGFGVEFDGLLAIGGAFTPPPIERVAGGA